MSQSAILAAILFGAQTAPVAATMHHLRQDIGRPGGVVPTAHENAAGLVGITGGGYIGTLTAANLRLRVPESRR
jgi:hypothetical protein